MVKGIKVVDWIERYGVEEERVGESEREREREKWKEKEYESKGIDGEKEHRLKSVWVEVEQTIPPAYVVLDQQNNLVQ